MILHKGISLGSSERRTHESGCFRQPFGFIPLAGSTHWNSKRPCFLLFVLLRVNYLWNGSIEFFDILIRNRSTIILPLLRTNGNLNYFRHRGSLEASSSLSSSTYSLDSFLIHQNSTLLQKLSSFFYLSISNQHEFAGASKTPQGLHLLLYLRHSVYGSWNGLFYDIPHTRRAIDGK